MGMGFLIGCFEPDDANLELLPEWFSYFRLVRRLLFTHFTWFRVSGVATWCCCSRCLKPKPLSCCDVGGRGPKNQSLGSGFTCFLFSPRMFGEMIQFHLAYFSIRLRFHQLRPRNWTVRPEQFAPKKISAIPIRKRSSFNHPFFRGRNVQFRGV